LPCARRDSIAILKRVGKIVCAGPLVSGFGVWDGDRLRLR
jgi:hypothetical protein